ncbi:hypothetical protein DVH05_025764 [Phytophthora capsici]|nr:hypothetical protein DVH05_025764 [Phytophthora capsici]
MILVSSWGNLAMRFVFAISMLGNLNNMKKLVRARPTKPRKIGAKGRHRATVVAPFHTSFVNVKKNMPNFDGVDRALLHFWLGKFTEIGFFVWGLMILIIHLHAESMMELPQCSMQVKPWSFTQPSCSLLELNCFESGFGGRKGEITAQWSMFDPTTVVRVVVRHCYELELPDILTKFSHLKEFKIYNSTIITWGSSAAITESSHPKLTTLFLIRVNMTDGVLPMGLQDFDFPQSLEDIEFCVTNLRSLPQDIDLKWPQYASIYLEASEFEDVPSSLIRLAPYDLSMSMNPISTIPKELFESESIAFLSFGGTLVSELPGDVETVASSLYGINLSDTNISFFWSWIDALVVVPATTPPITAGNTPYCYDIQLIFGNVSDVFSFPHVNLGNEVSILTNASMSNWYNLKNAVSCDVEINTYYPLEFEDEYSMLN